MAQTIKIRRSSVPGQAPSTSQLALGELALNTYDGKLYAKKSVNGEESIVELSAGTGGGGGSGSSISGITVGTYGGNSPSDVGTAVTAIRFDAGSGFSVVAGPGGTSEARISMNSTFKTWKVAGQTDLVAEGEDTMTFEGDGIVLTTSYVNGIKKLSLHGFSGSWNDLTNKPTLFSGAYSDLTGKPDLTGKADLVGGKLDPNQLPALAISEYLGDVASQSAMLAKSGQRGDWVVRTDTSEAYMLIADGGSLLADWRKIATPADAVSSVAGRTGAVTLTKSDVGLSNVDNTSDANKPISTATQAALDGKASTAAASAAAAGLMSAADKSKLDGVAAGATANSTDAQLRDRSTHTGTQPANTITGLSAVATTGTFSSLTSKPTTLSGYGITDAASSTHIHGNITNAGAIGSTANLPIITGTSGVLQAGSFGTTANTFCQGNDSRLSDTRNTNQSLTFNSGGSGGSNGSTFNGGSALTVSYNTIGAAPLASPALTGTPTAPTAGVDTNSTQIATTGYVINQGYVKSSTASSTYAPINHPTFTGIVTIPAGASISGYATTSQLNSYALTSTVSSTYAPINNPTFTGTVTIPAGANISGYALTSQIPIVPSFASQGEAEAGTNNTKIMTPLRVAQAIAVLSSGGGGGGGGSSGPTYHDQMFLISSGVF
jgi:hypothetical protein